jgi:glycosyltransferase involved in cell wall biosynthesis
MADQRAKRIVVLHDNANPDWRWISHHLPEFEWEFVQAPVARGGVRNKLVRLRAAWRAARRSRNADLLLTFDEGLCAALVLSRTVIGNRPPLVSYYFNFDRLQSGLKQARQSFLFRQVDRFVVSSTVERKLYAEHFGIDPAKFDFLHWGVNAPVASDFRVGVEKYICAVGGNSRDYAMLMQVAADRRHIPFVIVARPANLEGLIVPANVTTLTNIPYGDAMAVVAGARAMALPLVTTETPCGHVTIVSAFYLGCPLVTTRSTGVDDYVTDGETGLVVAQGSAADMGAALDRLWQDRALADRLAASAKSFAQTHCTEANYPAHVRSLLNRH